MAGKKYRTVMLIDDNEIDNLINQKMIEAAAVTENIYTHTGAKSAIEFLKNMEKLEMADQVLPDVIFLDIDMPLMDGFHLSDGAEFERWLDGERARLTGRYAAALETLAEASESRGCPST